MMTLKPKPSKDDMESVKTVEEPEVEESSTEEEVEEVSPKSVGKWTEKAGFVHNQVLRIRAEDSHIGEDNIRGGFAGKDHYNNNNNYSNNNKVLNNSGGFRLRRVASAVDFVLYSRPVLPCSPLSGKTSVRAISP